MLHQQQQHKQVHRKSLQSRRGTSPRGMCAGRPRLNNVVLQSLRCILMRFHSFSSVGGRSEEGAVPLLRGTGVSSTFPRKSAMNQRFIEESFATSRCPLGISPYLPVNLVFREMLSVFMTYWTFSMEYFLDVFPITRRVEKRSTLPMAFMIEQVIFRQCPFSKSFF